ncbi:hypothetical protein ES288_D02G293400v1 [Gossypium darwinii]|uniref:AMP-dependent synthetase/ligase domain-containing protein n=1 Tax=Gossypium darwinii TaxID=34276 RepID=A0A5D2DJQ9_GOSDA|nr:hypothetical protein ES288_D02G293400v1 [Gossypium darwinii]
MRGSTHTLLSPMFDYLCSKTIATILWPLHVLPTKFVYKEIRSANGIQKTAKSRGGSLPTHIEKFYETIGLEVQNGYGLIETSPCVTGRQPYYNVYNSLFRSVFEIYRYGSVCFFWFRHHCFVPCFKSIDLDLFVLFVCFLCTFAELIKDFSYSDESKLSFVINVLFLILYVGLIFIGIQKRISSSPNAIKLIVFSFIRISLA